MTYARRVDTNHQDIVTTLRQLGWSVKDILRVGQGFPDLVCARQEGTVLCEVKDETGRLTQDQQRFLATWRGPVYILRSFEHCVQLTHGTLPPWDASC